jgi:hypothetical protein
MSDKVVETVVRELAKAVREIKSSEKVLEQKKNLK